jgi:hypothetical protein
VYTQVDENTKNHLFLENVPASAAGINPAIGYSSVQSPSCHSRKGGNPVIPWFLLDSGSLMRWGRNDVLDCRVNNLRIEIKTFVVKEF